MFQPYSRILCVGLEVGSGLIRFALLSRIVYITDEKLEKIHTALKTGNELHSSCLEQHGSLVLINI